ncbi:MAG: TlpA family protein disulfide reductase, partial [Pyrinomonadaceae bacterium]
LYGATPRLAAQPAPAKTEQAAAASAVALVSTADARTLYEEAANYARQRYAEFERTGVAYDPKLVQQVEADQRALAARHAATLGARGPLAPADVYYLGRLYHLAGESGGAVETMRSFLGGPQQAGEETRPAEPASGARFVVALHEAKLGRLAEAEIALADYVKHAAPPDARELYLIASTLAAGYRQRRQLEPAAAHARAAFDAVLKLNDGGVLAGDQRVRDDLLYGAAESLSDLHLQLKQTGASVAVLQGLRRLSVSLPSVDLYRRTTILLGRVVPPVAPETGADDPLFSAARLAPEIEARDWLGQRPATLVALRGRVVLLDFWAASCAPCRAALPHLKAWQEKYGKRGLSVIALTQYETEQTRDRQRAELRQIRRAWRLPFGFAVADTAETARRYNVTTIPAAALIDRRGVVRYLSVGARDEEIAEMEGMIERLLAEAAGGQK